METQAPQEMLDDPTTEKIHNDEKVVMIKNKDGKMIWGQSSGLTRAGKAHMESLATTLEIDPPHQHIDTIDEKDHAQASENSPALARSANEGAEAEKQIVPKPAYVYLNNRWAKFVVGGVEYTRDEFFKNKLDEDAISEVRVPSSCRTCGKPWQLQIVHKTIEVVPPPSPESRGLKLGIDYDVSLDDPNSAPLRQMTGIEVARCCANPKILFKSFLFEVTEKAPKVKKPKAARSSKKTATATSVPADGPNTEIRVPSSDATPQEIEAYLQAAREQAARVAAELGRPSNHAAAVYMRDLFQEDDLVCIFLIHGTKTWKGNGGKEHAETRGYFQSLKEATDEGSLRLLNHLNKEWHVYVCMNSIRGDKDERGRTVRTAAAVRTTYIEIDEDGEQRLAEVRAAVGKEIPRPYAVLQSSPHKYQIVWRARMTLGEQGALNRALQTRFGGDPQSVDSARVLRLPLFRNIKPKYGKDFERMPVVTIEKHETPIYALADFHVKIDVKEYERGEAVADAVLGNRVEKIESFLEKSELGFSSRDEKTGYWKYEWTHLCPNSSQHTTAGDTATVSLATDGMIGAKCYHAHCAGHDWKWLKEWMEKRTGEKLIFNDPKPEDTNSPKTQKMGRKLSLVKASSRKPKSIRWFWEGKILANKPNVLFGEPGLGKGFLGMDFIARMTTGQDFYDGPNENDACDAIVACSEDSWDETILPRLLVAGANTDRVYFLLEEHDVAGSVEEGLMALDEDLPRMAEMLKENPDIRIIYIDPLATYMGELDPNKDKEVRPIYTAMKTFAEKHNVCFILVAHPNKNEEASAINRLSGAKALTSVFRNTWLIEKDPEDKSARIMASVKGNLAGEDAKKGLRFRVENVEDTGIVAENGETIKKIGRLVWTGETDKDADELLQAAAGGGREFKRKQTDANAQTELKSFLSGGAAKASDFHERAAELNLPEWAVRKAKSLLKVKTRRIYDDWYWALKNDDLDVKKGELDERYRVL